MKKKTDKPSRKKVTKFDGLILYSRQGDEEGMLLEGTDGSVIAWFFEDSNNLVSAETLNKWAKQAKIYERALKKLSDKPEPRRLTKGKK